MDLVLVFLHVTANVFWIGGITAVGVILLADKPDPKARGALATMVYLRVATPAFIGSFLFGLVRFVMDIGLYGKQPWIHIKLTFALAVIALHHVIGGRAKKMANGDVEDAGPTKTLLLVNTLCAVGAVLFVIMGQKIFGR